MLTGISTTMLMIKNMTTTTATMITIITPRMAAFITGRALPECMFRA